MMLFLDQQGHSTVALQYLLDVELGRRLLQLVWVGKQLMQSWIDLLAHD